MIFWFELKWQGLRSEGIPRCTYSCGTSSCHPKPLSVDRESHGETMGKSVQEHLAAGPKRPGLTGESPWR